MLTERVEEEIDLLERHVNVLKVVKEGEAIGMGKISDEIGIPKHKVRYSLRILEKEGVIEPSSEGAISRNTEELCDELIINLEKQIEKLKEIKETVNNI